MGALMLAPVAAIHGSRYALFTGRVWVLLLVTGVFQAVYYVSLASAYRAGEMSLAYPLARSAPVLIVMAASFALGQGERISASCVAGILRVVAGSFMGPMKGFATSACETTSAWG